MADLTAPNSSFITDQIGGFQFPYQDYVVFMNLATPGKATIVECAFAKKLQIASPPFASGGVVYDLGEDIKKAEILVEMWTAEQLKRWDVLCQTVLFRNWGDLAISVSHPVLEQIKLTGCVIENVSGLQQDERGVWSSTVKIVEFRRTKKAGGKPVAEIPSVVKEVPTARDAADTELAALRAQRDALAAGP